nr:MFS transporter [Rhizobium sophorae]
MGTFAGGIITAIGVMGWALANTPWLLYAAAFLSGIGWSARGAVAINAIVSPWFAAKRPLALGVAFNGGSVGGVIFSPVWVALIDAIGFPAAALSVSAGMLATLGVLSAFVLTRSPEALTRRPTAPRSALQFFQSARRFKRSPHPRPFGFSMIEPSSRSALE